MGSFLGSFVKRFHAVYVLVRVLRGKVAIDLIDHLRVGIASLLHDGLDVPPKVKAQADVAVAQTMNADLRKAVLLAQAIDESVERGWVRCN